MQLSFLNNLVSDCLFQKVEANLVLAVAPTKRDQVNQLGGRLIFGERGPAGRVSRMYWIVSLVHKHSRVVSQHIEEECRNALACRNTTACRNREGSMRHQISAVLQTLLGNTWFARNSGHGTD